MDLTKLVSEKTITQILGANVLTNIIRKDVGDYNVAFSYMYFTNSIFDEKHRTEMLVIYRECIIELYEFLCIDLDSTLDSYKERIEKIINLVMNEINLIFIGTSKYSKYLETEETMLNLPLENAKHHIKINFVRVKKITNKGYIFDLTYAIYLYRLNEETKVFNIIENL